MAENVSQAFMSLSINCAKCHNHPLEKWTNDQYYSFANLFARAGQGLGRRCPQRQWRKDAFHCQPWRPDSAAHRQAPTAGTARWPGDRKRLTGRPPRGAGRVADRPENPYFTRSIANRVWANFGRGIVEPVDDLRVSNPASNEPLLEAISAHLVENRYDLKALMRLILQSETYLAHQRAAPGKHGGSKILFALLPTPVDGGSAAGCHHLDHPHITQIRQNHARRRQHAGNELYRDGTRAAVV